MTYKIKHYGWMREFEFGRYKGHMVGEIIRTDPAYIDWCIINLEHFYISWDYEINKFPFSYDAAKQLTIKSHLYNEQLARELHLTCRDGHGEHLLEGKLCEHCGSETCLICGCIGHCPEENEVSQDDENYKRSGFYDEYGYETE